jgi:hypothetical protein
MRSHCWARVRGASLFGRLSWLVITLGSLAVDAHAQSLDGMATTEALRFGTVAVLGPGAVTVFPQGGRLADGQAYLVGPEQGGPGQVLVTSRAPNMSFSLILPSSFTLSGPNAAGSLSVVQVSRSPGSLTTGPNGSATVAIGGTLQFSGIPAPGTYVGSFSVALTWP